VIVIPGTLGSQLINSRTGEVEWPSILRDDREDFSLPISPNLSANRDDLVAGKIVDTLRLGRLVPEVYVYRDLIDALGRYGGYREGDWDNPPANGDSDTYYVFPYDWRRDNVENARILVTRVERLKERLKRPDLRFSVIAHSMGGLIARYAAMYGAADLPPDDIALRPTWAGAQHIAKIVMLGVPNEGSADAFATMLYGYSITEGLRRRVPLLNKLTAGDAITSPALFQLLPHRASTRFLNEDLQVIQLDLYDPKVWREYGWAVVNDPEFRQKYAKRKSVTSEEEREAALRELDAYFEAVLKRAKRFHEALDTPLENDPPVTLLAVGGDCEETLDAPVVLKNKDGRWVTLIRPRELRSGGKKRFSKRQVTEAMYAPGDGRVTRRSLLGANLTANSTSNGFRSPVTLSYAVFGCDLHGQLQRNKTMQDNTLTALVTEVMR
jgi:pimeloyl-ACP methyl ester carboxylesterase